jgi:hypothetical protein
MKSWLGIVVIIMASLFLLGMGNMEQGKKPGEIPIPDNDVSATITDNEGMTLSLTQFSINGQTYFTGKLGAGRVALPLNQIRVITFSADSKGTTARIELTDNSQMTVYPEKGITVYGRIKVGTYQVSIDQLKKIEILSFVERKKGLDRF